jgi:hypothetical protein
MALETCRIPVDNTFALIDEEDHQLLSHFNWHLVDGYARTELSKCRSENRLTVSMHVVIMRTPANKETDHINRNTLDNRKINLRCVTHSINMHNSRMYNTNTSGARNVYWLEKQKKWVAKVCINQKLHHLGHYDDIEVAKRVVRNFRSVRNLPQP